MFDGWFSMVCISTPLPQDLSDSLISAWRKKQLWKQLRAIMQSVSDVDQIRKAQLLRKVCVYTCACVYVW